MEESPDPGAQCDEAASAQEAARQWGAGSYDLALLDISLPGASGLNLLKGLHRDHPGVPIVIHQHARRRPVRHPGADPGRRRLSHQGGRPRAAVLAVRRALSGGRYISATLAAHPGSGSRKGSPPPPRLSDRDFEILRLIGGGRTPTQIACELFLSVKTVSSYRSRILQKMGLKNNSELVRYALKNSLSG